ncbi:MAG: polysaccharide biosynthesis protein [Gracilibacter sp. BRH_c7a]|nr:MAG: polysaccharide biosynthesis protein [Gracilibacter sp. BRH_c7a]
MNTRLIAKNATALGVAGVLAKAISAVVGIFVTRYLGPGPFGDYAAAYAYVGTFILFSEIGISQLMVQEGSRDQTVIPKYFGNTLLSKTIIAVFIYLLMLILMVPAGYDSTVKSMIIILGIAVGFNAINQSVYNYYQTKQQMYLSAGFQLLTTVLIGGLTVLVILGGLGVVAITATHLASYIFTSLLLYLALRRKAEPKVDFPQLPQMVKRGLPFGIHRIFYNMYFQMSILMLSLLTSNVEVGVYSAAFKLVLMLIFLPSLMASAIYPVLFQLGVTDKGKHQETIEKFFKFLCAVGIPISLLLFVLAEPIMIWLYDGKFNDSIPIMMIVCWFFMLECMSFALGDILTTTNRQWLRTAIQGSGIVLLFILILLLYPIIGIYGAAYGMIIVEALIFISYYAVVRLKVYKIRLWRHLTVVIIASAVMGIAAYALYNFHPVLSSFLAGILYLFVLIIWDRDFRKVGTYALRSVLSLVGRS